MATQEITVHGMVIENKQLARLTDQLYRIGLNVKKSYLKVASIIHQIDEKGLAVEQFGGLTEYGEQVLGLKKAQTYALKSVGERFINTKTKESIFAREDSDYSVTQLQALLPIKDDELLQEWNASDIINPSMTVTAIKEVVKEYRKPQLTKGTEEVEDTEGTEEVEEPVTVEAEELIEIKAIFIKATPDDEYKFFIKDSRGMDEVSIDIAIKAIEAYK